MVERSATLACHIVHISGPRSRSGVDYITIVIVMINNFQVIVTDGTEHMQCIIVIRKKRNVTSP